MNFKTYFDPNTRGVFISDTVRTSEAYKCLSPTQKLVLLDFIRKYYSEASRGKDTGFAFTRNDTLERVSLNLFYEARKRICEVGFFQLVKPKKPYRATMFVPSTNWKTFHPMLSRLHRWRDEFKNQFQIPPPRYEEPPKASRDAMLQRLDEILDGDSYEDNH